MADRNDTNLDRDEVLYEQVERAREGLSARNPFVDRIDRGNIDRHIAEQEESSVLRTMAKIAGLGVSAYALGRTIPKDVWVDALHKMGQYGRRSFGSAIESRNKLFGELADNRGFRTNGRREAPGLGLADFLEEQANPMIREVHQTLTNRDARSFVEDEVKRRLQAQFATSNTGRLTGLTVSDVLKMSTQPKYDQFKVLSKSSVKTLQDFRSTLGDNTKWFDNLTADQHLFKSTHGKLPSAMKAGDIRDIRWASRRAIGDAAYNGLGFQIPFVGFKPVDLFTPFFKLAGKRKTFARVGQGQKLAEGVVTPKAGASFLIDGELTHFGPGGISKLHAGRKFRTHARDGIANANLAKLGQHPIQKVKAKNGSFWSNLQETIGFGPQYREEAFVGAHLTHRARAVKGLAEDTIEWKSRKNIRVADLSMSARGKMESATGKSFKPSHLIENPHKELSQLSFVERQKAMLGRSSYGEFVVKDTRKPLANEGFLNLKAKRPTGSDFGSYIGAKGQLQNVGETAFEDTFKTKANVLAHFAGTRLNQLMGATAGIGFKPSMGRYGAFWNMAKVAAIGATLNPMNGYVVEAAKYVNYIFERMTNVGGYAPWSGFGIDDVAIKGFEGVTLGIAGIKDATGITAGAQYAEGLMPGIAASPLSGMARTLGPALYGMKRGPIGLAAGAAAGLLTGGGSDIFGTSVFGAGLTTTSGQLARLYGGESKERVRSSRWWMLGRQSFYGEGTDRFDPHWVALAKSDYEYTNSQYGSKKEYFSQESSLPTFHNLFGLGSDSNYYAEKHAASRPYPEAPDGTPMHGGEMIPSGLNQGPGLAAMVGSGYLPPSRSTYPIGSQNDISYKVKQALGDGSEMLGVYKFLGETVLGRSEHGPVLANASAITSVNRAYWDKDLGGLFGMTELLRRFITAPNEVGASEIINNLPNQMPSFLPGARSAFTEDRGYYKDFTLGDPYTQVKGGEYRLPGAGYESINELHSGQKGVYDPVDAMLILSDVAPYSKAYKHFSRVVESMDLDNDWRRKVEEASANRDLKAKGIAADFVQRRFSKDNLDNLAQINDEIRYNAVERFVGRQYENLTMDLLPEVGRMIPFGTLLTHKLFPHHTPEQDYLERQVYAARSSNWSNPYEGFVRPKALTLVNENPLTASAGGAMIGLMGTTPGTRAILSAAGAVGLGGASAIRAGVYGQMEGGYVPAFRRREEEVLGYFDKLEYLRYEKAAKRADMLGNLREAKQLRRHQSQRTMIGLDYGNQESLMFARSAVPRNERAYFDSFANAGGESRSRIMGMTPEYMQDIYSNIWNKNSVEIDKNAAMAEFMMNNPIPGEGWEGWNPGVQNWQIMSRTMDTADNSMAIDLHRQNISLGMMRQTKMQMPNIGIDLGDGISSETYQWHESTDRKIEIEMQARRRGFNNIKVSAMPAGGADSHYRSNWRITRNREAEVQAMIYEAMR